MVVIVNHFVKGAASFHLQFAVEVCKAKFADRVVYKLCDYCVKVGGWSFLAMCG